MVAATRGNHGAGLVYAGQVLGVPVTVCVPRGNSPSKNAMMCGYGASTLALEFLEQAPSLDAIVLGVGGGSQAVGALIAARALNPSVRVFALRDRLAGALVGIVLSGGNVDADVLARVLRREI